MAPDADSHALSRRDNVAPATDLPPVHATAPRRRRWWPVALILLVVLASAGWYLRRGKAAADGQPGAQAGSGGGRRGGGAFAGPVPVGVATSVRQDIPVRITALGAVAPLNTVTVRPRVDGQLMQVGFQEGEYVHQGDLLAVIDPRQFQVQLEQAEGQLAKDESQLANAKVQLARYQLLLSQDSIARSNVDDAASMVAQLEGGLKVDRPPSITRS